MEDLRRPAAAARPSALAPRAPGAGSAPVPRPRTSATTLSRMSASRAGLAALAPQNLSVANGAAAVACPRPRTPSTKRSRILSPLQAAAFGLAAHCARNSGGGQKTLPGNHAPRGERDRLGRLPANLAAAAGGSQCWSSGNSNAEGACTALVRAARRGDRERVGACGVLAAGAWHGERERARALAASSVLGGWASARAAESAASSFRSMATSAWSFSEPAVISLILAFSCSAPSPAACAAASLGTASVSAVCSTDTSSLCATSTSAASGGTTAPSPTCASYCSIAVAKGPSSDSSHEAPRPPAAAAAAAVGAAGAADA
mmetsp:Transcript_54139/g.167953  ORF Transcript_54139/g.167953 Transcript_54139/m.167953 type:complete len:318 (-) Transcript_54139:965-1918(-)